MQETAHHAKLPDGFDHGGDIEKHNNMFIEIFQKHYRSFKVSYQFVIILYSCRHHLVLSIFHSIASRIPPGRVIEESRG